MVQRVQILRGTTAEWVADDVVLLLGELGTDTDTGVIKIGDGSSTWSALPVALASQFAPFAPAAAKAASTVRTSTSTLAADPDLAVNVEAGMTYQVSLLLFLNSAAARDLKIGWDVPSGATLRWVAAQASSQTMLTESSSLALSTNDTDQAIHFTGTLVMGVIPGVFALTWAQNSAGIEDTKLLAGSSLIVHPS